MSCQTKESAGFTLIELSISIVIIGLIVAGVVSGQELVKQSQFRSVLSDVKKYKVTLNTFKLKYDALPGDMINATSYWGGTGNGDGDKNIEWSAEAVDVWQHFSLAGLLPQAYSGVLAYNPGITFPNAAVANSGFYTHQGENNVATAHFSTELITLYFGKINSPGANGVPNQPLISAADAHSLDKKTDDGLPFTGSTRQRATVGQTCAQGVYEGSNNAAQRATNLYNLSVAGDEICLLIFVIN